MSGGFFRGTSAEQDTRFSNKQAKLLKSQKFAPELEHLVDMTKVKMDVMRPWIAARVTELLGFEDEVLINFIYGLLDGKEVNGKEVQISLTGFMEKNTGKFMKELWTLILSAQKNASGVPQQFLDAKEEETRKKKVETDRIANEIQRKKEEEGIDLEPAKIRKMDDEADVLAANNIASEPSSKHQAQDYSVHSADEMETGQRNGSRGRSRMSRSPRSAERSFSSPRGTRSRSISKSLSNSRSYSGGRHKSRSISKSPQPRGSSISSDRMRHSMLKRSVTPPRRYSPRRSRSPPRRRLSDSRRRSSSRSRRRSLSPTYRRLRSPLRRRLRSPMQRRSRSPIRRRSRTPIRYRLRSPIRHRSPSTMRRRSPSPHPRRSPSLVRRRSISPSGHRSRSPVRRRSPSPVKRRYRRSPSSSRYRSETPIRRRSPVLGHRRSPTPRHQSSSVEERSSQSPVRPMSQSPVRRKSSRLQRSPVQSDRETNRTYKKLSPDHKGQDSVRRVPVSLRSPQRNPRDQVDSPRKAPAPLLSRDGSQSLSGSPPGTRRSASEDTSPYVCPANKTKEQLIRQISASPPRKSRDHKSRRDGPESSGEEEESKHARDYENEKHKCLGRRPTYSLGTDDHKRSSEKANLKDDCTTDRLGSRKPTNAQSHTDGREARKRDLETKRDTERTFKRVSNHEVSGQPQCPAFDKDPRQRVLYPEEGSKADEKSQSHLNEVKSCRRHESESKLKSIGKIDEKDRSSSMTFGLHKSDKRQSEFEEKRKHKRSKRQETESDDSYDSEIDGRKEAKRRRKEEKRLRKEERHRRKEERRRRREEHRVEKRKTKTYDTVTPPSDNDKSRDGSGSGSDGECTAKGGSHASDAGLTESEQQKKLEFELRNKALESIKAKKDTAN